MIGSEIEFLYSHLDSGEVRERGCPRSRSAHGRARVDIMESSRDPASCSLGDDMSVKLKVENAARMERTYLPL